MKIIRAECKDLVDIILLIRESEKDMSSKGMYHWNSDNPSYDVITRNIRNKSLYIIKNLGICIGMIAMNNELISEYNGVIWVGKDEKVLYIHHLAVHPVWQNKGIARIMLDFAERYALDNKYTSIRLDICSARTHEMSVFKEKAYFEAGEIIDPVQKSPFICYEKELI